MNYRDQTNSFADHKKWSEWKMQPPKPQVPQRKLTNYASAFVFAMSAIVVSGAFQHLTI
ncbi:hypothetical protein RXV86_12275 [Alisedimentitalea sp. MJ-SS2]|uniref:hypothetical protein n=1 Tax=Aliisedimentitalea sp. MJ-SS2 TaxID=3049795 RepID=UPI002906581C|nr:hypothetical protein [Alisedimentitalea sp. MJ-SS2]MDU8928165.1 hypothetical protein [Alisedimentitalea sp. MJ-SS2]